MHPALSVIFFTTLSGAGYGLLALLGVGVALGIWPRTPASVLVPAGIGGLLVGIGLFASTLHLGQPLRAWRAFSQWRSSWLSREGVCAVLTYLPLLALAVGNLGGATPVEWLAPQRVAGALLAAGAALTVYCTARIYSSLRTIPAWHNTWVVPGYMLFAAYSGGLWLWLLGALQRAGEREPAPLPGLPPLLLAGVVFCALLVTALKLKYWRDLDQAAPVADIGSATGLDRYGDVAAFERPHTEHNYITREMGFVLARRHAQRLRAASLAAGQALPLACIGAATLWTGLALPLALAALLSASLGIFVERWLFFAQARHVVNLYYGATRV